MGFRLTPPPPESKCPRCGKVTRRLSTHAGSMVCQAEALRQLKLRAGVTLVAHETRQILERAGIGIVWIRNRADHPERRPHAAQWAVDAVYKLDGMPEQTIIYLLRCGEHSPELQSELALHALGTGGA